MRTVTSIWARDSLLQLTLAQITLSRPPSCRCPPAAAADGRPAPRREHGYERAKFSPLLQMHLIREELSRQAMGMQRLTRTGVASKLAFGRGKRLPTVAHGCPIGQEANHQKSSMSWFSAGSPLVLLS